MLSNFDRRLTTDPNDGDEYDELRACRDDPFGPEYEVTVSRNRAGALWDCPACGREHEEDGE